LPTLTAAAWYNKMLPADLQAKDLQLALRAAEQYAAGDYAGVLAARDSLNAERKEAVASHLARFTGLPVFWFSVKMRERISPKGRKIPPFGRGFSRHKDLSVRCGFSLGFWAALTSHRP
jgi:hypothetical protein